jgi:hypothetical protein
MLSISESDMAAAHGITLRTYRKWEQGASQRGNGFLAFSKQYGVSLDWLMRGRGEFSAATDNRPPLS